MTDDTIRTRIADIVGRIRYRFFPGRWTQAEIDNHRQRGAALAAELDAAFDCDATCPCRNTADE